MTASDGVMISPLSSIPIHIIIEYPIYDEHLQQKHHIATIGGHGWPYCTPIDSWKTIPQRSLANTSYTCFLLRKKSCVMPQTQILTKRMWRSISFPSSYPNKRTASPNDWVQRTPLCRLSLDDQHAKLCTFLPLILRKSISYECFIGKSLWRKQANSSM